MPRPSDLTKGDFMIELELTRTEEDHRRYLLEGVGTLRLEGLFSRNATAETGNEYCNPALTFGRVRGASPRPWQRSPVHRRNWQRAKSIPGNEDGPVRPRHVYSYR